MTTHHQLIENIKYGNDHPSLQAIDLYLPFNSSSLEKPKQLLVYVHGGAWKKGDKADSFSKGFILSLATKFPTAAFCSVNYRLSTPEGGDVRHPAHNQDVVRAIDHLGSRPELSEIEATYLMGHSVGAFTCLSIAGLFEPPPGGPQISAPSSLSGLVLLDGIFDLPELLNEYPSYSSFVNGAFGSDRSTESLASVTPLSWKLSARSSPPRVLIVHSKQDSLLTTRQPELAGACLRALLPPDDARLEIDFDSVSGDHDESLLTPQLASRIYSFVTRDLSV